MSGNIVKINEQNYLAWYITDNHLPALVTFLDSIGHHLKEIPTKPKRRRRHCDRSKQRNQLQP